MPDKVLDRCEICHHGKWRGDPCKNCKPKTFDEVMTEHMAIKHPPAAQPVKRAMEYVVRKPTILKLASLPKFPQSKELLFERVYKHLIPELGEEKAKVVATHIVAGYSGRYMKGMGLYGYKQTNDLRKLFRID